MGQFKEMVKKYHDSGSGGDDALWKCIERIDGFMDNLDEDQKEEMMGLLRTMHEDFIGPHYDRELALDAVEQMYHMNETGQKVRGEHWSIGQAEEIFAAHKARIKDAQYNAFDMYVALNASYNDLVELFREWFDDDYEKKLIEYAVVFWFQDADAPDGKIWRYMGAM